MSDDFARAMRDAVAAIASLGARLHEFTEALHLNTCERCGYIYTNAHGHNCDAPWFAVMCGTEPLIAHRQWLVWGDQLVSLHHKVVWHPGQVQTAVCQYAPWHQAPQPACMCGIYAFKDPAHERFGGGSFVTGTVALWGRIVEHRCGYRAQYARVIALHDDALARRYGVRRKW